MKSNDKQFPKALRFIAVLVLVAIGSLGLVLIFGTAPLLGLLLAVATSVLGLYVTRLAAREHLRRTGKRMRWFDSKSADEDVRGKKPKHRKP